MMEIAIGLIVLGAAIVVGAFVYDKKAGRSEEYGPLGYAVIGALIFVAGLVLLCIAAIINHYS